MDAARELVERLSGALQRQDLDLEEEQGLLEALLRAAVSAGLDGVVPEESESKHCEAVLHLDDQAWTLLVSYTFERRYGWSESADGSDDRAMDSLDNRAKKKINDTLEQVRMSCTCLN
jgi:hypothetical protein